MTSRPETWDVDRYTSAIRDFQVPRPNGAHLATHSDGHKAPGTRGPWRWPGRYTLRWTHRDGIEPLASSVTSLTSAESRDYLLNSWFYRAVCGGKEHRFSI